jgi:hypothetical protein
MAEKNTNIIHCKTFQNLPKIGIFGLILHHLATLKVTRVGDFSPVGGW